MERTEEHRKKLSSAKRKYDKRRAKRMAQVRKEIYEEFKEYCYGQGMSVEELWDDILSHLPTYIDRQTKIEMILHIIEGQEWTEFRDAWDFTLSYVFYLRLRKKIKKVIKERG